MTVSELIRFLQTVTNQNKEIYIKETVVTENTFYSTSKPMTEANEYGNKVVVN